MNETPLHEPLIAEEGKEKERVFTGTPERIVNICLASISALIIYWTVYVSADVMWKHGLYIMTVFCMTLVIYPFEKKPKVNHVSLVDWLLIIGSIAGSAYAIWEYLDRFMRLGMLTEMDIFFGCLMLFLGLEVGRRVIGWSLTLVSIVLILYSLYGFVIPGHFGHGGFDLEAVVTQVYAGMEGYYGLSAKMMIQYVAPFILMGAFLEKSGAGDFFIRLAFALTRNTVGGPAKAAVIGSALLGSISGSAVANVSSTGVLTIPMMKKVGYRPHVAGAIEAAASTGGQIMPPIMGAVAFLMAEFTQIPYLTIVTVATGPIILYYITLMAFIHFEAKKHNIGQMKDHHIPSARTVCSEGWHFFVAIMVIIVIMAVYGWDRYARLTRNLSRSAYTEGYACALEGLGLPTVSIALRHILPNIASALVVNMTLNFPGMILLETSLSFLGVGVQPPMSSLGTMLGFGRDYLTTAWWIAVIPGLVIVVSTLSMSILGDWVQQKLEPAAR